MRTPSTLRVLPLAAAVAAAGACGDDSGPTDSPDKNPPSVLLGASTAAVTDDGILTLTADASDDVGVASVTFHDGGSVIGTRMSPPWSVDIDLTAAANGRHLFRATASDAAGNEAQSGDVVVDVAIPTIPSLDDFGDNWTDSTQWVQQGSGGPTSLETGGRLEFTIPPNVSGIQPSAGVGLRCGLTGDVDVQVDYEVVTWPAQSGVRSALASQRGGAERVSFAAGDFTGMESYAADHGGSGGSVTTVATTDIEGQLRLTRSAGTYTTYYWDGAAWQAMQSTAVNPAEELRVGLGAWTNPALFGGEAVTIAFDNFRVNAGQMGTCD